MFTCVECIYVCRYMFTCVEERGGCQLAVLASGPEHLKIRSVKLSCKLVYWGGGYISFTQVNLRSDFSSYLSLVYIYIYIYIYIWYIWYTSTCSSKTYWSAFAYWIFLSKDNVLLFLQYDTWGVIILCSTQLSIGSVSR